MNVHSSFIFNSSKLEIVQMGMRRGRITTEHGSNGSVHSDGFTGLYMSTFVKLYTLNMCSFLYVNYAALKLQKKSVVLTFYQIKYILLGRI